MTSPEFRFEFLHHGEINFLPIICVWGVDKSAAFLSCGNKRFIIFDIFIRDQMRPVQCFSSSGVLPFLWSRYNMSVDVLACVLFETRVSLASVLRSA